MNIWKVTYNKYYKESEFGRNVIKLMTGASAAQIIPIIVSPVLTRLYTPGEFGVLALYSAVVVIIGSIATGKYDLAIVLPKDEKSARSLVTLGIILSAFIALSCMVLVITCEELIARFVDNIQFLSWLYLIPFSVFIYGSYQCMIMFSNRHKQFGKLATSKVVETAGGNLLKLLLYGINSGGLIIGNLVGRFLSLVLLLKGSVSKLDFSVKSINCVARKYSNFPKHLIVSHGFLNIYMQMPIFVLSKIFMESVVGYYSFANTLINLPSTLIAKSLGDVFFQKATEEYNANGRFDKLLLKMVSKTFLIAVLPFFIFFVFAEDLFSLIFGSNWHTAGLYAKILSIGVFISFVITPIDKALVITQKTKTSLMWHILRLLLNVVIVVILISFDLSIVIYLYMLVGVNISMYLLDFYLCYKASRGNS
jgi:O-antigen/teichoic acid export membrane protein